MGKRKKVCFLSNVHPSPFDTRIFFKEARTLSAAGYEVVLIVQHDKAELVNGIRIIPMPKPRNRLDRMTRLAWRLFRLAIKERADVYHFHNPELIPVGLFLKLLGKTVIYDVHEAYGEKILSKPWIKPQLRPFISKAFSRFERISSKCFDHVIAADRFAAKQFKHRNVTVLANYAVVSMVKNVWSTRVPMPRMSEKTIAVFVGDLTEERGLFKMVEAVKSLSNYDVELHLIGRFDDPRNQEIIRSVEMVKYFAFLPLDKVFEHLMAASIGLILFQPVPSLFYAGENTNKLFEYMACGLAVIASDFPNLRELVEGTQCGICVNPTSPKEISTAIRLLHENPQVRAEMGQNGRKAILKKYNWEKESEKLLEIYRVLLGRNKV